MVKCVVKIEGLRFAVAPHSQGPPVSAASTHCDGTASFLKTLCFMSRLQPGPAAITSSSLTCRLWHLAPSCFPFLLKRSSVILDIVFILRQREHRGVLSLFLFLFLNQPHCSGAQEPLFIIVNLKPFEICNFHLDHKLKMKTQKTLEFDCKLTASLCSFFTK